jgi:hypothetical protein
MQNISRARFIDLARMGRGCYRDRPFQGTHENLFGMNLRRVDNLNRDAFHLVQGNLVAGSIVELGRARAFV